jgi:RNA polymerase sigma factor (sigma-70 family)
VQEKRAGPVTGDRLQVFTHERRHLLAVASRILGSSADAQDVVQEAWIRYAGIEPEEVRNPAAWLTTVVTRQCLDVLRRRHETLPEPAEWSVPTMAAGSDDGPEEVALLAWELTDAITVLLERLTPPQRVALILHDAFGTPFDQVGWILGTSPGSAKKLASRARARVRHGTEGPPPDLALAREVVAKFLRAAQQGDVNALIAVLDPEVSRTSDPQVLGAGAAHRVQGAELVVAEARRFQAIARRAHLVEIDGRPALAVISGQRVAAALVFVISGDRIRHYDVVADPQRLALLHIEEQPAP